MTKLTLKAAQINSGKTQDEIAAELGVVRATVGNWIRKYKQLRVSDLLKICRCIGCRIEDLDLGEKE